MTTPIDSYIRVGLLLGGVVVIWWLLGAVAGAVFGPEYSFFGHVLRAVLASVLTVPLIIALRRGLDGGTLAGLGLPLAFEAIKPFVVGALAFLVPSALGFALVLGFGWASISPLAPVGDILAFVPVLIVLVVLYEALPEELAFRGYIYKALAERHARIVAVFVQAGLFALWGALVWMVSSGTMPFDRLAMFGAVALVLGLVRVTTGSVWACIGLHTGFQTVAQLFLSEGRDHFAIEGSGTLQLVALGVVPFSLAMVLVGSVYRDPVAWREKEGRGLS